MPRSLSLLLAFLALNASAFAQVIFPKIGFYTGTMSYNAYGFPGRPLLKTNRAVQAEVFDQTSMTIIAAAVASETLEVKKTDYEVYLDASFGTATVRQIDAVGNQVGEDLDGTYTQKGNVIRITALIPGAIDDDSISFVITWKAR